MPINGPSSYLPTTIQFQTHWKSVNAFLGVGHELVLPDGVDVAAFIAKREALVAARDVVDDEVLDLILAREELEMKKERILRQINAVKVKFAAVAGSSVYARVLPLVPSLTDGPEVFTRPLVQTAKLWAKLNAAPPPGVTAPLVLRDGLTQAAFAASVAELQELYVAVLDAEQDVALALERRNDVQDGLYALMKKYRQVVVADLPEDRALVRSLPQLTATSSRTPEPVTLTGVWNAESGQAELLGTESDDPDLEAYQLCVCAGTKYEADREAVVATVKKGAPPQFATTKFLTREGASAAFRVYVVLKSGGHAGSNAVVVVRP